MSHAVSAIPDVTTFAANVVVFLAAVAAAVAGAMQAVKKIKESWLESAKGDDKPKQTIASAMLVETTTMMMWSESNRGLANAMSGLAQDMGGVKDDVVELRYAIQRLTDRIGDKL